MPCGRVLYNCSSVRHCVLPEKSGEVRQTLTLFNYSSVNSNKGVFAKSIYNVKFASSNPYTYLEHFRRAKTRLVYIYFVLFDFFF